VKAPVRALIIQPDGKGEVTEITPELEVLQGIVGGWIEAVTMPLGDCHLYCDEEGKFKGKAVNMHARMLAHLLGWHADDLLVGPIVFLGDHPAGEESSVPDAVLSMWRAMSGATR